MTRCPLCNCETPAGHACSEVPALLGTPLMVDHMGQGLRVTVAPLPKPDKPEGKRERRRG